MSNPRSLENVWHENSWRSTKIILSNCSQVGSGSHLCILQLCTYKVGHNIPVHGLNSVENELKLDECRKGWIWTRWQRAHLESWVNNCHLSLSHKVLHKLLQTNSFLPEVGYWIVIIIIITIKRMSKTAGGVTRDPINLWGTPFYWLTEYLHSVEWVRKILT